MRANESEMSYAGRVGQLVHSATYHCLFSDFALSPIDAIYSRALLVLDPSIDFKLGEGLLSTGQMLCGLCHQRAYILTRILNDNGVEAITFGVNGHVTTKFEADEKEWLIDPDYNVPSFRYDVSEAQLEKSALTAYEVASWSNHVSVASMIASKGDNGPLLFE